MTGGWGVNLKTNTILSTALLLGSSICFAFTEVGKIETVVNSRKIANIKLTAPIDDSVKNLFLGTKDKNCETKILKRDSTLMTVDISSCDSIELKAGSLVYQIPEYSSDESSPKNMVNSDRKRHRLGLGLRLNNKLRYGSGTLTSGGQTSNVSLEYTTSNNPFVLSYSYIKVEKNSWGIEGGISYFSNTWDQGQISGYASQSAIGSTTVLSPFFNGVYMWDQLYLAFGVNLSSLSHSGTSLFMTNNNGTLGFQLGLGIDMSEKVSFLIESKSHGFGGATVTSGSDTANSGSGYLNGLNFMVQFKL